MKPLTREAAVQSWKAWQAEKQARWEADERALATGKKTREHLIRENSVTRPEDVQATLPWDEILG